MRAGQRCLDLLDQCRTISQLKQIQSHLTVTAALYDPYASSKVITFAALNDHSHARLFFRHASLHCRTPFMCNTMIKSYVDMGQHHDALAFYRSAVAESLFLPNNYTFSFLLTACSQLGDGFSGACYHCLALRLGWVPYDFVRNGLIHMYVSCELVEAARRLFDECLHRDVIAWTALINGCFKCGKVDEARQLFDEMPVKNSVSWSAVIHGYAQVGLFAEALEMFKAMQNLEGVRMDHACVVGALTACAFLGALDQGRWIHAYLNRNRVEVDRILGTALIEMYAKCGVLEMAYRVFEETRDRDVYAFTALISGLSNHGRSEEAMGLFERMQYEGVVPNEVTFICVLSACSRMGLTDQGLMIFQTMREVHGVEPGVQHYGCLVDLLGRAGMLEEAKKVVEEMPMQPDSYVLGALLNACRVHGNANLGKEMVESIARKKLDHGGVHVLLSNIYASLNKWDEVVKVRKGMEDKGVQKVPGCSSIEVNGSVFEFVVGDRLFPFIDDVVETLHCINKHLKFVHLDKDEDNNYGEAP
ncbi:hypothetical protein MLD38_033747 [Melastoma candidum]|uniref:Uncharacterized protein n=1 Tax=Melastoma candidum TaxID=119954 RepID=A0ACB9M7I9_9MYRT|nr:hypothetical protein MLD38_033747 [Melastoma candidum]